MVAVTPDRDSAGLIRRAARIASRLKADLDVVHVAPADGATRNRGATGELRELAANVGARWHEVEDDDPVRSIARVAREHQITQIVIGSIQHSWWHFPGGGPIVRQVIHEAGAAGIDVHLIARRELPPAEALGSSAANKS